MFQIFTGPIRGGRGVRCPEPGSATGTREGPGIKKNGEVVKGEKLKHFLEMGHNLPKKARNRKNRVKILVDD